MRDLPKPVPFDSNTPADVVVTDTAPPRITDPTLGVPLGEPPVGTVPAPDHPAHTLVTIGDSLTHGVSSGAVFHTTLSWPAQVAAAAGVSDFATPRATAGRSTGCRSTWRHSSAVPSDPSVTTSTCSRSCGRRWCCTASSTATRTTGSAATAPNRPPIDVRYHNLGIYGWDVRDALCVQRCPRSRRCWARLSTTTCSGPNPSHNDDVAALSVLAPFGIDATQVRGGAASHGANGDIGTLVVALGSNNALDAVVSKAVNWSAAGFDDLDAKADFNVWTPNSWAKWVGVQTLKSSFVSRSS